MDRLWRRRGSAGYQRRELTLPVSVGSVSTGCRVADGQPSHRPSAGVTRAVAVGVPAGDGLGRPSARSDTPAPPGPAQWEQRDDLVAVGDAADLAYLLLVDPVH